MKETSPIQVPGAQQISAEFLKQFDYRFNLIVDSNNPILVQKAWRDHFSGGSFFREGKDGGKAYLGVTHSEDAMTWNVFRSLQEEGQRGCEVIADVLQLSEVRKILFWGCDVEAMGEEQQLLNILIRITDGELKGTMTEPDLVVITDKEVALIECKLNLSAHQSPWRARLTSPGEEGGPKKRMAIYKKHGFVELNEMADWEDIYQIIRQYVYAKLLGHIVKKIPLVIPLVNGVHLGTLEPIYQKAMNSPLGKNNVLRDLVTWQALRFSISRANLQCGAILINKMDEALEASKKQ